MKAAKTISLYKPTLTIFGLFLSLFLFSSSFQAQEIQVKGIVKGKTESETEILSGATVYLKGTNDATSTNRKGEFTFPKKVKIGDVLVFSYLGYVRKRVKITEKSSYLTVVLSEDDNVMLGALKSNKRYKSKRTKQ